MAKSPWKPSKPDQSSPSPQEPLSQSLRLFPAYVHAAAERMKQQGLQGELIEPQFAADEPPILRFLETLHESGERQALAKLARLLRNYPLILAHPYIWGIICHVCSGTWPSADLNKAAHEWLIKLVTAWSEGMTLGYRVTITNPGRGRRGRTPELFPHLYDREGWFATDEAAREYVDALQFQRVYEDLMSRLEVCVRWKTVPHRYRTALKAQLPTAHLVREQAEKIGQAFEHCKSNWKIVHKPLSQEVLHKIVQVGLEVRKGGNPRHTVACGLLATLTWCNLQGKAMKLTPSLVESTLDTLRACGIRQKEPTQERPATSTQTFWTTETPSV